MAEQPRDRGGDYYSRQAAGHLKTETWSGYETSRGAQINALTVDRKRRGP